MNTASRKKDDRSKGIDPWTRSSKQRHGGEHDEKERRAMDPHRKVLAKENISDELLELMSLLRGQMEEIEKMEDPH